MDLMVECGLTSSLISPLDSYYRKIKTNNPETMLGIHFRNSEVKNWTNFDFLAFQKLNQSSFCVLCQLKSPNVCDKIRNHTVSIYSRVPNKRAARLFNFH